MDLSPQSTLHDQILEVVVDEDPDQPPGLEPVPVDEWENDEAPNLETPIHEIEFEPLTWEWMCTPLTPIQIVLIHQMEYVGARPRLEQALTEAV